MPDTTNIQEWLSAAVESVKDLCTTSFSFPSCEVMPNLAHEIKDKAGAYIALVGDHSAIQLGMAADECGCYALSRALLCMEENEELSKEDMSDTMGEIANIIAGGLKSKMDERNPNMRMGLPIMVHGCVDAPEHAEIAMAEIKLGPVLAHLLVLRQERLINEM
jgi:CheY-specific phosphatase CheX